jgi:hypothetical protein
LRTELEADFAHLYRVTREELRYISPQKDVFGDDFPSKTFGVLNLRASTPANWYSKRSKDIEIEEVVNYVRAMNCGLARLRELPLSLRLIREIHAELLKGVRGARRTPGDFRRSQNWIGPQNCTLATATFVPPPVPDMHNGARQP